MEIFYDTYSEQIKKGTSIEIKIIWVHNFAIPSLNIYNDRDELITSWVLQCCYIGCKLKCGRKRKREENDEEEEEEEELYPYITEDDFDKATYEKLIQFVSICAREVLIEEKKSNICKSYNCLTYFQKLDFANKISAEITQEYQGEYKKFIDTIGPELKYIFKKITKPIKIVARKNFIDINFTFNV